jgi:hypothetical protein
MNRGRWECGRISSGCKLRSLLTAATGSPHVAVRRLWQLVNTTMVMCLKGEFICPDIFTARLRTDSGNKYTDVTEYSTCDFAVVRLTVTASEVIVRFC